MKIIKILNNSLVLSIDKNGNEKILMGKGIGFHKKIGDKVSIREIEKEFVLKDDTVTNNFLKLSQDIDDTLFSLVNEIIDYAEKTYNIVSLDYLYLALTDHLDFLIKNKKKNVELHNFYNDDLKHFFKNEYEVGLKALEMLERKTGLEFEKSDANNIALHFVTAQENRVAQDDIALREQLIKDILDIVKYVSKTNIDDTTLAYGRFVTHLSYFVKRIFQKEIREDNILLPIYNELLNGYKIENQCVDAIDKYLNTKLRVRVSDPERCYLIIHINRIIN